MKSFLSVQVWLFLALLLLLTLVTPWHWWVLDLELLAAGQWWRLWLSQLTHLNPTHLALNMLGVLLSIYVAPLHWMRFWLWPLLLWLLTLTGLQLIWFTTGDYLGFSGALYGLLFLCLWFSPYYPKWVGPLAATVVAIKVLSEQLPVLASSMTSDMIGAPVMTQAHLFGWLSSLPLWLYLLLRSHQPGSLSSLRKA